jgi:hypothetical protein
LNERCIVGRQYETSSSALFKNYKQWAEETNEYVPSQKDFSQSLLDHGFGHRHARDGWVFKGVALTTDLQEPGVTDVTG